MYRYFLLFFTGLLLLVGCTKEEATGTPIIDLPEPPTIDTEPPGGTVPIPASPQRMGDAEAGFEYLITGDYVNSGPPLELAVAQFGDVPNLLNRTGDNAQVPYPFNAVESFNGVKIVAPNCLTCHAEFLNDELIIGLGNNSFDYTQDRSGTNNLAAAAIAGIYGADSPEAEAYEPFRRATEAISDQTITEVIGVNSAGKLAVVLEAHRNLIDLTWLSEPKYSIPEAVIPSDVPAWWLTKKKNALYYAAIGRGDYARTIMAASILTLQDSTQAREIDENFPDVLAFIESIEPPAFPKPIDTEKAAMGEKIFNLECAKCHGTYGTSETFPNLLVDLEQVQTDPLLATSNFGLSQFLEAYNTGWFGQEPYAAELVPTNGYIAPPLDGVWATAPYLHNGSVPTLEDLLNSEQRPIYWERTFDSKDYDYQKVGWQYEIRTNGGNANIYDTTLPGYGNGGHFYGDHLTTEERGQLVAYLKTL